MFRASVCVVTAIMLLRVLAFPPDIWLPAGSSMPECFMFCVVFGFGSSNNISISQVCIGRLCETSEYGRYFATAFTVATVACLVGIPR
ncbi:hypothetical protein VD0001_g3815 [Verticillium dahliae]|nr:hypothetical protein VD0001_g3815 [Verticillium dahliae]